MFHFLIQRLVVSDSGLPDAHFAAILRAQVLDRHFVMSSDSFDSSEFSQRYFARFASAYCRDRLGLDSTPPELEVLEAGTRAGLRLHKFKRSAELPRVRRVLGILKGLSPKSLLDVGSGKGTFLWPLLDALSDFPVTSIDKRAERVADLQAVARVGELIDLSADYDAHIRVVYCEAPWNLLQKRNRERAAPVPEQVLSGMLQRWSVPDLTEAHALVLNVTD